MSESKKTVITASGEELPKNACRKFGEEFYKIGDPRIKGSGDCYKIGDRYYRDETGYIVFDEIKKEYVINNDSVIKGVIGVVEGELVFGYFSKNPIYNTKLSIKDEVYTVVSIDVLSNYRKVRYHKGLDCFYDISVYPAKDFNTLPMLDMDEKYKLPYNCDPVLSSYKKAYDSSEIYPSEGEKKAGKALKGLTYGLEFETVNGRVPNRLLSPLGLIPLRDGSISGLEYASVPYEGGKGIAATKLVCEALGRYTQYDDNCSLHLHVGGMPRTKEFLVALFKTLCLVQDEMFSLFPLYKKYNFGVKRKNYTKALPALEVISKLDHVIDSNNLDKNFDEIFKFLSMGISMTDFNHDLDQVTSHPSDPRGRSKWNIRSRYHWVNLIPIVFGNKQTVEFRIHTPTTDFNKVASYLFICGGIINYVKDNYKGILNGDPVPSSITDIVFSVYKDNSSLCSNLSSYITTRRNTTYSQNTEGNVRGDEKAIKSRALIKKDIDYSSYYSGNLTAETIASILGVDIDIDTGMPTRTTRRTTRSGRVESTDDDLVWYSRTIGSDEG